MQHVSTKSLVITLVAALLWLLPSIGVAATKARTCGSEPGQSVQHFLSELNPGDTLLLSGICNEHVVIGEGQRSIIIDGQGATTINAPDNTQAAVRIRGNRITLRGLVIVGGRFGVQVTIGGTATIDGNIIGSASAHGIVVVNGSHASITNNTVENNGSQGIQIAENASADIGFQSDFATVAGPNIIRNNGGNGIGVNDASHAEIEANMIQSNTLHGIRVAGSASARIGAQSGPAGTFASANTIEDNGIDGVAVSQSSSAQIVENVIKNNVRHGVSVSRSSQANVANNQIDGNWEDGILVSQTSAVNLGNDSGTDADDQPNSTTVNNGGAGIRCSLNSTANGRLGSLNGDMGSKDFGRTFRVTIAANGDDGNWEAVDEVDDANPTTANATLLTITGITGSLGSVDINSRGCHDSLI